MKYYIRRCMVSDTDRIYELCFDILGYKFPKEQVEKNIRRLIGSKDNLLLVAVDESDYVIGFMHANDHNPIYAPPMKNIMALAVDEDYRGNGIGHMLLEAAEEWARQTGASGLRVNSGVEQKRALGFYKSLGFEYIKTVYNSRKMFRKEEQ